MRLLLDTCALLHFSLDPTRLSAAALHQITEPDTEVWCSPISIGEIACLQQRGRIEINGHWKSWFRALLQTNGWNLLPITETARRVRDGLDIEVGTKAFFRDFPGEHEKLLDAIEGIPRCPQDGRGVTGCRVRNEGP
jgi:hypothetical protein